MEQCFYGNGFDGAIHSDLDMGFGYDLVDLAMEASDGIHHGYNFYGKQGYNRNYSCRSKRFN
jgi:hypothetical protein